MLSCFFDDFVLFFFGLWPLHSFNGTISLRQMRLTSACCFIYLRDETKCREVLSVLGSGYFDNAHEYDIEEIPLVHDSTLLVIQLRDCSIKVSSPVRPRHRTCRLFRLPACRDSL